MKAPPIPDNEPQRLATLYTLRILDTSPEERFDRVTRLACRVFGVPVALVSLVDAQRQWFKSRQGTDVTETPREVSFCGHAILGSETFIVPDALEDERFHDNPLVAGGPRVRFYAGHPLAGPDGSRLGTLCIVDNKPRTLETAEIQLLQDMAGVVEDELFLIQIGALHQEMEKRREVEGELKETENRFRVIFDGARVGIALIDPWRKIIESNPAMSQITGYPADELKGMKLAEFTHPDDVSNDAAVFTEMVAGRLDHYKVQKRFVREDDTEVVGNLTVSLVRNALGEPHHAIAMVDVQA